jgi:hypothetical protein
MDKTTLTNIALGHLGARRIEDYATDNTVEARAARIHFDITFRALLRRHQWSFGVRRQKYAVTSIPPVPATLAIAGLILTATTPGAIGNTLQATTTIDDSVARDSITILITDGLITITSGDQYNTGPDAPATLAQIIAFIQSDPTLPFTAALDEDTADPTDPLTPQPLDDFTGGIDELHPNRSDSSEYPLTFTLPADSVRLIRLATADVHNPIRTFSIEGRALLTHTAPFELVYLTEDCLDELDPLFIDAFTLTLASKLAADVAADPQLKQSLLQQIEALHLPAATGADAKETHSGENFGPRALASMSALVQSRYSTRNASIYRPTLP